MRLHRSRRHAQIRRLHRRRQRFASAAVATSVVIGILTTSPVAVVASGGVERAATSGAPATPAAGPAFPWVAGVDLAALGYRGVDLDRVSVASLAGPFPELPTERATDIRSRLVVGTAQLEGLREAEYILYENTLAMDSQIRSTRRTVEQAVAAVATTQQALDAASAQLASQAAQHTSPEAAELALQRSVHELAPRRAAVRQAEAGVGSARAALAARSARRDAHWAALSHTRAVMAHLYEHLRYLGWQLDLARRSMLPAGRWLAEVWRGRHDVPVVTVEGFRVHAAVAGSLRDLLADARADGIVLTGSGHRPIARQIELRMQNCGGTHYDVYERPGGTCSPPTAKPGRSLHESGLAIDFEHDGQSIVSRSSPAYRWLAAHAPSYGFYNLPSEPWHWSASGV